MVAGNSIASVHQYTFGKYKIKLAGGNGGIAFHIKSTVCASTISASTKSM